MQHQIPERSRPKQTFLFLLLVGVACCPLVKVAGAARAVNPYRVIVERNVFGLRPIRPVIVQQPAPPLPNVILTGITTILKGKRALLKVQFPAKPPTAAKEQYCILAEGQREGPIEVLEIDTHTSNVKINNSGTVMTITFPKQVTGTPTPAAPRARPYLPRFPMQAVAR
jgi:hypothetical protein